MDHQSLFRDSIYRGVLDEWNKWQQLSADKGFETAELPDPSRIPRIIDVMHEVSHGHEEGRHVNATVCYATQRSTDPKTDLIQTFTRPFTLESRTIVKLAPAFDYRTSAFLVEPDSNNRESLLLWGAVHSAGPRFPFFTLDKPSEYSSAPMNALYCRALSPGHLEFTCGVDHIASIKSNGLAPRSASPFFPGALPDHIVKCLEKEPSHVYSSLINSYIQSLMLLFYEASKGHGSTFIIVPDSERESALSMATIDHGFTTAFKMEQLLRDCSKPTTNEHVLSALADRRELANRLGFIARHSFVDGAVLLTSYLEPIAFGAILRPPSDDGMPPLKVVTGPNQSNPGGQPWDVWRAGTRHTSAVKFIRALQRAIGFVVSEDGPVRGFAKESDSKILCWPDCRDSVIRRFAC